MKSIIIYKSVHRKNTEKMAQIMSEELNSDIKSLDEIKALGVNSLSEYDLIGFGSGIYQMNHHKELLKWVKELPTLKGKKSFIFSTCMLPAKFRTHIALRKILKEKELDIIGEFSCKGQYNINKSFIKVFNQNRPNEKDITKLKLFIEKIIEKIKK